MAASRLGKRQSSMHSMNMQYGVGSTFLNRMSKLNCGKHGNSTASTLGLLFPVEKLCAFKSSNRLKMFKIPYISFFGT